jgi:plasmid stability protein
MEPLFSFIVEKQVRNLNDGGHNGLWTRTAPLAHRHSAADHHFAGALYASLKVERSVERIASAASTHTIFSELQALPVVNHRGYSDE